MTNAVLWTPNFLFEQGGGDVTVTITSDGYHLSLWQYFGGVSDYTQRWTVKWVDDTLFWIKNASYDWYLTDQGFGNPIGVTQDPNYSETRWTREIINGNLWVIHSVVNPLGVITAESNVPKLRNVYQVNGASQQWVFQS